MQLKLFLVSETMSPLDVRRKVCMAPFHARSKVWIHPLHVRSKVWISPLHVWSKVWIYVMEVTTEHKKGLQKAQTAWKALFCPKREKSIGQNPPQELEVSPGSRLHLLVAGKEHSQHISRPNYKWKNMYQWQNNRVGLQFDHSLFMAIGCTQVHSPSIPTSHSIWNNYLKFFLCHFSIDSRCQKMLKLSSIFHWGTLKAMGSLQRLSCNRE